MRKIRFLEAGLRPAVIAAVLALAAAIAGPARAQSEIIDSEFNTCTEINCSATSIAGWVGTSAGRVLPWTAKFFAVANACLRLQVSFIRTAANLEMTVVAPNGVTRYRNDQGGTACTNCPLVKINPTPVTGFYTAVISSNNGAVADTDFHILFGQYPPGNPNCASPTPVIP